MRTPTEEERTWAMFCHLAAFAGYIIPFGHIVGPLVLWLIRREQFPMVDEHGKESLNFQITMTICAIVSAILVFVVIGVVLLLALAVFDIVMIIMGTLAANSGKPFRYPLTIRFIS
jgi:uncharacterized Tic20 family protein